MTTLGPGARAYDAPHILDGILRHLAGSDRCAVQRSGRSGWRRASRLLYRDISWHALYEHIADSSNATFYRSLVETINNQPETPCRALIGTCQVQKVYPTGDNVREIWESCTNLRTLKSPLRSNIAARIEVQFPTPESGKQPTVILYREHSVTAYRTRQPAQSDMPSIVSHPSINLGDWEGYVQIYRLELSLHGHNDPNNWAIWTLAQGDAAAYYDPWLSNLSNAKQRDKRISSLQLHGIPVTLCRLAEICAPKDCMERAPMKEVISTSTVPFSSDELVDFLERLDNSIESLHIVSHNKDRMSQRLHHTDLANIQSVLGRRLPKLRSLALAISDQTASAESAESEDESQHEAPAAACAPWGQGKLEELQLHFSGNAYGRSPGTFPFLGIIRSLAAVVAPGCKIFFAYGGLEARGRPTGPWAVEAQRQATNVQKGIAFLQSLSPSMQMRVQGYDDSDNPIRSLESLVALHVQFHHEAMPAHALTDMMSSYTALMAVREYRRELAAEIRQFDGYKHDWDKGNARKELAVKSAPHLPTAETRFARSMTRLLANTPGLRSEELWGPEGARKAKNLFLSMNPSLGPQFAEQLKTDNPAGRYKNFMTAATPAPNPFTDSLDARYADDTGDYEYDDFAFEDFDQEDDYWDGVGHGQDDEVGGQAPGAACNTQ